MIDGDHPVFICPAPSALGLAGRPAGLSLLPAVLRRAERAAAQAGLAGRRQLARTMARRAAGAGGDIRVLGHRLHRQLGAPDSRVRRRAAATRIALYAAVLHRGAMVRPFCAVWRLTSVCVEISACVELYCDH
jgi:hypothetical protein